MSAGVSPANVIVNCSPMPLCWRCRSPVNQLKKLYGKRHWKNKTNSKQCISSHPRLKLQSLMFFSLRLYLCGCWVKATTVAERPRIAEGGEGQRTCMWAAELCALSVSKPSAGQWNGGFLMHASGQSRAYTPSTISVLSRSFSFSPFPLSCPPFLPFSRTAAS